jgi:hypothetical protein
MSSSRITRTINGTFRQCKDRVWKSRKLISRNYWIRSRKWICLKKKIREILMRYKID